MSIKNNIKIGCLFNKFQYTLWLKINRSSGYERQVKCLVVEGQAWVVGRLY